MVAGYNGAMKTKTPKAEAETIQVIVGRAGKSPVVETIANDLEPMQHIVGGFVEPIHLPGQLVVMVNEDAALAKVLPHNEWASSLVGTDILGDVFLCRDKGQHFTSVTAEDIKTHVGKAT